MIQPIDYETKQTHQIGIYVSDKGTPSLGFYNTVIIDVIDVNDNSARTTSNIGKVNGTLGLFNLTKNASALSNTDLQLILDTKGNEYEILKDDVKITLTNLYLKEKNVVVQNINIINLSVGSLVVDYIVTINLKKSNITKLDDINPIKKFTQFFENSTYTGYTSPQHSAISGTSQFLICATSAGSLMITSPFRQ